MEFHGVLSRSLAAWIQAIPFDTASLPNALIYYRGGAQNGAQWPHRKKAICPATVSADNTFGTASYVT